MSEEPQKYETPKNDPPRQLTAEAGTLFIWRDDGNVEVCVPVDDLPIPQQMASMQVPMTDLLEFVARGVVLPIRQRELDNRSDVELLLGTGVAAKVTTAVDALPPEKGEDAISSVPPSREHPTIKIRRPGAV